MGRATKITTSGKGPEAVGLEIGWAGRLGEIVTILSRGVNKPGRPRLPARPVDQIILRRLAESPALSRAMLGNGPRTRQLATRIVQQAIGPGVPPPNAPSTARRKGGDRRALRNVRGRDAIYRMFRVFVRKLKSGRFG